MCAWPVGMRLGVVTDLDTVLSESIYPNPESHTICDYNSESGSYHS